MVGRNAEWVLLPCMERRRKMSISNLCPTHKDECSALIKEIKKEKELYVLVSSYEEFCLNYSCKPDREEYPYPKRTDILDEEKSVKWNREEIERLRKAFENKVDELNKYKNLITKAFEDRIVKVMAKDNGISAEESLKIWNYAYAEKHSDGIAFVVSYCKELSDLYDDLLEIRGNE